MNATQNNHCYKRLNTASRSKGYIIYIQKNIYFLNTSKYPNILNNIILLHFVRLFDLL